MVSTLELDESIFKLGTSKIFFKAGVLAELEEKRDAILFDIFSRIQAAARMWAARRQMRKILHRAVAVRVIQRNARVYGDLREWPWWQLYTKVRPLLAATRNDEELRKKEMELALVRERAERDKQERETLEKLQMALEAEKRKVEDDLEAERALTLDKDALLERSKQREADLEEEVNALQSDINTLDSQVNRAMCLQKESEEKYENLREALDQAADHLGRLEQELQLRDERELGLQEQLRRTSDELDVLQSDLERQHKVSQNLEGILSQREEWLARAKEREQSAISELREKVEIEIANKYCFSKISCFRKLTFL
jgi:myosin protein heavy chain